MNEKLQSKVLIDTQESKKITIQKYRIQTIAIGITGIGLLIAYILIFAPFLLYIQVKGFQGGWQFLIFFMLLIVWGEGYRMAAKLLKKQIFEFSILIGNRVFKHIDKNWQVTTDNNDIKINS